MSGYAATRYSASGVKTGTIVPFGDTTPPTGFLDCNGNAVSRSTYADLFAVIGTTYGAGDGSSTFNLPNLEDNVAIGKSNTKSLGSTGGANTVTPTGNISNRSLSTAQLAAHNHQYAYTQGNVPHGLGMTGNGSNNRQSTTTTGSGSAHNHNLSVNATSTLQPYLATNYVIKT